MLAVKKFVSHAVLPKRARDGDAGMDLSAAEDVTIAPGRWALVSTGIGFTVPTGTYGRIAPRSGVSTKGIIVNAGVVDRSYTGVVKCLMVNIGDTPFEVKVGDRICQVILERIIDDCEVVEVASLEETDRGAQGFGSSGR